MTTTTFSRPSAKRSADFVGDENVVDVYAFAEVIAAAMARKGYVAHLDEYADRVNVYRNGDAPELVNHTTLMDRTREAMLRLLHGDLAEESLDPRARSRARATLRILEHKEPGAHRYVRRVAEKSRDLLDMIGDDERDAIVEQIKANRPAPEPHEVASRREYHADRRAKLDAEAREQTKEILVKWLPSLGAGKHELGDVWAAWRHAVDRSEKIKAEKPGVAKLGRTKFYEVLAEVTTVYNGAARKRYAVVAA
jgi:hypothetical protein